MHRERFYVGNALFGKCASDNVTRPLAAPPIEYFSDSAVELVVVVGSKRVVSLHHNVIPQLHVAKAVEIEPVSRGSIFERQRLAQVSE